MGIGRKYILDCIETQTSGVTTISAETTFNLTLSFSGVRDTDGIEFNYSNVTLADLADMTDQIYDQRVTDFLIFVGIKTLAERGILLTQSSVSKPDCD